ncbi:MAG: DUF3604 domain-containing protein [Planctomycetes bacterium]|nr:DUF3604 domain-containing protein [Planctomycetota bacterium]MBL7039544.1 DUF3604 domain-containing protein [Pirellulaceae bacterium]
MSNFNSSTASAGHGRHGACTRRRFLQTAALAATASSSISTNSSLSAGEEDGKPERLFWGDLHTHTALSDGNGQPEDHFEIAKSHLDFWAMTDHAFDKEVFSLDYRKFGTGRRLLNEDWQRIQRLCREHEDPGRFVPLLGYEWTNFRYGHHNVYYRDYDQPIRMPSTLPQLYESLKNVDALVIPHHPGYPVGICGKDWTFHDERLSPFVEIYSLHGSSETPEGITPLLTTGSWMGPGGAEGCVQAGLARGHKFGIIASTDSHGDHPGAYDLGLVAAYAKDLTRESLWEAFYRRRVYAVTGDRIRLDFSINGHPMGSTVRDAGKRVLRVSAVAWNKVERVEIIKNNSIFHTFTQPMVDRPTLGKMRVRFFVEGGWDARAEHDWAASLALTGGRILHAIPCFRGHVAGRAGTGISDLADRQCQWTWKTEKARYDGLARRYADAMAFEVECSEHDKLQLAVACDQLKQDLPLAPGDILRTSTIKYMENIPTTNDGAYWHNMKTCAKFKVHQGWHTDQLTLDLTCEDDGPVQGPNGTDFYYVRLVQRNGQRAWSSPIWVEQA